MAMLTSLIVIFPFFEFASILGSFHWDLIFGGRTKLAAKSN